MLIFRPIIFLFAILVVLFYNSNAYAKTLITAEVISKKVQGGVFNYALRTRDKMLTIQTTQTSERALIFDQALLEGKLVYITMSDDGEILRVLLSLSPASKIRFE